VKLRMKALTGISCPDHKMDRILKAQGFRSSHNQPPVYNMKIRDTASGGTYRLTLPTSFKKKGFKTKYLGLDTPTINPQTPMVNSKIESFIPESVVAAAWEKIEEIASYLKS
jgi:hypothetical protein